MLRADDQFVRPRARLRDHLEGAIGGCALAGAQTFAIAAVAVELYERIANRPAERYSCPPALVDSAGAGVAELPPILPCSRWPGGWGR